MSSTSVWEYLDFMSVEAKLYIKGKDRFKTKFGSVMSSLSFISIFVLSCFFFKFYLEKVDVNVVFLKDSTKEALYMDLNYKPFFFRLKDIDNKDVDPRLVSITIKYFYFTNNLDSWETLETEPCKYEKHLPDPKYKKMLEKVEFESHICIKNDKYNLNITDDPVNNNLFYFNLYVNDCNNSTLNNNTCYPREVIKDYTKTSNIYFSYYFPNFIIDHYNSTSPLLESYTWIERKVYNDMYYGYSENIKVVNYTSDEGIVMQDLKTWTLFGRDDSSYVDISLTSTTTVPNTMSSFTLMMVPGKVDFYKRTYPKIQFVLANIGGVLKFIMTISSFLTQFYSSQVLDIELSNNFIYDKYKDDENNMKIINNTSNKISKIAPKISKITIYNKNLPNRSFVSENLNLYSLNIKKDKEKKRLAFLEALLPKICLKKNSTKHNLDVFSKIIRTYMSTEYILKLYRDFYNLKHSILNEKENELLNYMRCQTIEEHYKNIDDMQKKLTTFEINNLLKKIEITENVNIHIINKIVEED
jgi:hypothetical protein